MRRALGALGAAAALLAGCGLGPGKGVPDVSLRVSDGFGARTVRVTRVGKAPGADTVMRVLERHHDVHTIDGGGFVTSIDGLAGRGPGSAPVAWFYYLNGVEGTVGAAAVRVGAGDRIWWDRHWWGAAMDTPAVVGSFPAPLAGPAHRPVAVRCIQAGAACAAVTRSLRAAGARTTGRALDARHVRVLVGPWSAIRGAAPAVGRLGGPPAGSGVFVRFRSGGRVLQTLDSRGRVVATGGPGTGLVAAVVDRPGAPIWVVTGTDAAGVLAAARRLDAPDLTGHFAITADASGAHPIPPR